MKIKSLIMITCLIFLGITQICLGATYSNGFTWYWDMDFSTTSNSPSDAGSIATTVNTGKSSGSPTPNTWANIDVWADPVFGRFPGFTTSEPTTLLTVFTGYYENYYGPSGSYG